jgi:succinate dehydrogenase/fumarate reductase flavoprotein subunit
MPAMDVLKPNVVHTLVLGSGAAGLNAAVQLHACGVRDVAILSEGLRCGTSINTGSDKQTYYKLSLYGTDADAPALMASELSAGGGMHGDLALAEAALSARAFYHLVGLGVPFPRDAYGQFVGYKTDHDPRQRATSIGPYTSKAMCEALLRRVRELGIPVYEKRVAVRLLALGKGRSRRIAGLIATAPGGRGFETWLCENLVFAVGGPGGLYRDSVYPAVHTGAIGLALQAGARAQGLPESQYGLASVGFRWNVSGTYMQVVPRVVSLPADGKGAPQEFLQEAFETPADMHGMVFLKGYQWPFDVRKVFGGSSLVDLLVYRETRLRGRRVFLDYRADPAGYDLAKLPSEAADYLRKSGATQSTPLGRLLHMNPGAVELYRDHGIDLAEEPLEVAVCAQHNNGGLAANAWWESTSVRGLFPVGEVNGSHGLYRPGGSALNSGQVGGFRVAEWIAARRSGWTLDRAAARKEARAAVAELRDWVACAASAPTTWQHERAELRERMTRYGAHIRPVAEMDGAVAAAWAQWRRLRKAGCSGHVPEALRDLQLCFAHAVYLEAIRFALQSGVGSRGSALALDERGEAVHPLLPGWRALPEDPAFRARVQETLATPSGRVSHRWVECRPIPPSDAWFETAWAAYRRGDIYA